MKRIILSVLLSLLLSQRLVFAQDSQVIRLGQAMTTAGDMIINNTRAQPARLPIGSAGQVLTVGATGIPSWSSSSIVLTNPTISGNLTFSSATAKIIPGATSLTFRNNADSAGNLIINDNGSIEARNQITSVISSANNKIEVGANSIRAALGALAVGPGYVGSTSNHDFQILVNNTTRWTFGTTGNLIQDATNGGNIVLSKAGTGLVEGLTGSLVAAGTTISDAAQVVQTYSNVDSASGTNGVKLMQSMTIGQKNIIFNNNASNALLVYPPTTGDTIIGYAAGVNFSLAARATATCHKVTATIYECFEAPLA